MGEVNSTQRNTRPNTPASNQGQKNRRVKKEKEEDPSDIVIYETSTSSTSEDESGGERGRRKRINKSSKRWESNGTSEVMHQEERAKKFMAPQDLKTLAIDEKNVDMDSTAATIHGILYGRDYKKEDEERAKEMNELIVPHKSEDYLVHKVTGKETIQGLALKYGVQPSAIKKINRLWNNDDMFARKEVVIPISTEEFLKYQASLNSISRSTKRRSLELSSVDKKGLITKFVEIAACEPDMAHYYLMEKKWNFTKALGYYFSKQEGGSDSSDVDGKKSPEARLSIDEKSRRALKEEMDDVWEEPRVKNSRQKHGIPFESLRNNLPATYSVGNANPSVQKVQQRMQERFAKQEEEIFEI